MIDILLVILLIIGLIVFLTFLVIGLSLLYLHVVRLITKNKPYNHPEVRSSVRLFSKVIIKLSRVKYTFLGKEKLPKDNFLLYSNHQLHTDPFILLYELYDKDLGGFAKAELNKIPVIRSWMIRRGILMLDRKNNRNGAETMIKAIKQAKNGQPIFIFPEGTRSRKGELLDFKSGAFKLAMKSKKPIYPVVFKNFYKHSFLHIKRINCEVRILDPIPYNEYSELSTIELSKIVRDKILKSLR
ncbi:lysophospholipid acyltransferase family protein [Mycoplasmatota bacterium zrk1]